MQDLKALTIMAENKCEANLKMKEAMSILMPHHCMKDDCIYGENDIYELLQLKCNLDNWPEAPTCALSQESTESQAIRYYDALFKKMMKQYITHATSVSDILSFENIKNHPNTIDIVKMFNHHGEKTTDPDIIMYEPEVDTLRNYGWKAFVPCFNDMVIKINKQRYFFIKLESIDEKTKSFKIRFDDYVGNRYDWVRIASVVFILNFENENDEGLPLLWDKECSECYEMFLTKYVNDMNWSKQEINFWHDVMGVFDNEQQISIELSMTLDEEIKNHTVIRDKKALSRLKQLLGKGMKITVIDTGDAITEQQRHLIAKKYIHKYVKVIATINYLFCSDKNKTVTKENGVITTIIDDLIITSSNEPINRMKGAITNV